MIETMFGLDKLGTPAALFWALLVGVAFGFVLERAGFGSSRRLSGVFYFTDMAVVKVMFSALVTAVLGLALLLALGWINADQIYFMPTVYGTAVVGGLVFGVGFVMGGWCPGTAAVGLASGRLDALVYLAGAMLGSIAFNEVFPWIEGLYGWGASGVLFVYASLGISKASFVLLLTLVAGACFWAIAWFEGGRRWSSPALKRAASVLWPMSFVMVVLALSLFIFPSAGGRDGAFSAAARQGGGTSEAELLTSIDAGLDHIEPEDLADRLLRQDASLLVVDIRTSQEYAHFHIRGAVNVALGDLSEALVPHQNQGLIVLYSNGMTHPAQARDYLFRMGFQNVYLLTDGLIGFLERCLKPVSLRAEPVAADMAAKINAWRRYFYASGEAEAPSATSTVTAAKASGPEEWLVTAAWLNERLGREDVRIIDVRSQPAYNTAHIPGSVCLSPESLRGVVGGVSSMLLPRPILAAQFAQIGLRPGDMVVIVGEAKLQDAALIAVALERLGHQRYAILDGGFPRWAAEKMPLTTELPSMAAASDYPAAPGSDAFTVDYRRVLDASTSGDASILDVRPADYYRGDKSDEARAGHIPGAVNRPYSEDLIQADGITTIKPLAELEAAYAKLLPSKDAPVIVQCRTGHQASQTFFVLRRLLGYTNVLWYDASWSEWAARPELPVVTGDQPR